MRDRGLNRRGRGRRVALTSAQPARAGATHATERRDRMADAREVAAQFLDAFNAHDEERIRTLNAENGVMEAPGDVRVEGRDAVTAYGMHWLNAFSDARLTIHGEIVEGDWVAQRFTFEGTHDGVLASPAGEI